jgi:hypothetical protein
LFFACGSKSIIHGSWVMTRSPLCFDSENVTWRQHSKSFWKLNHI